MASLVSFLFLSLFSRISLSLTTSEKQKILDIHNELRDRVAGGGLEGHPAAKDMNELIWDDGLAQVAQDYVDSCPGLNHNDDRSFEIVPIRNDGGTKWGTPNGPKSTKNGKDRIRIGENLLVNSRDYNADNAISQIESGWFDEYKIWTYGPSSYGCNPNDDYDSCGHYTAMVWANTRYVGCAYKNGCDNWNGIFICNYFPVGNFNGDDTAPYEKAASVSSKCTNCMSDRTAPCSSHYESVSETSSDYNGPYNALCGGGASSTQCDGQSYDRRSCDGSRGSDRDCNDGTESISSGRDVCSDSNSGGEDNSGGGEDNNGGGEDNTNGECNDCITLSNIAHNGDYCNINTHQGKGVYVKDDKVMYYTGRYWYLWDWDGSVDNLDDDPNDVGNPYAYCNDLLDCDGKWSSPPKWESIAESSVTTCNSGGDNTDNDDNGGCSDCRYFKIKGALDGEFCASGTHNGETLYTADDIVVYWTGKYWYAWDWSGNESELDDDPNDEGYPYAYCGYSRLSKCDRNWYPLANGDYPSKDGSSTGAKCGALESLDCLDGSHGAGDTVCMDPHNAVNTSFIVKQDTDNLEYRWEFDRCYEGKPMYRYDEYSLFYEERATESRERGPFWIVEGDEEYAYCNKEYLSDCIAGVWNTLVEKDLFAGYVVDKQMSTKECPYTEEKEREKEDRPRKSGALVVLLVLLSVFLIAVGIALCVYYRHINKKRTSKVAQDPEDGIALDKKELTQNDPMKETDATGMLEEIEN